MNTDQLIQQMTQEGAKKPMMSPFHQTLFWLLLISCYFGIALLLTGTRPDLMHKLTQPHYTAELITLTILGASASFAAFNLARPTSSIHRTWVMHLPVYALLALCLVMLWSWIKMPSTHSFWNHSNAADGMNCIMTMGQFSIAPLFALFCIMRLGAVIRRFHAGAMVLLSVSAFAALLMRFIEDNDNFMHIFIWHILPALAACLLGIGASHFFLRWHKTITP